MGVQGVEVQGRVVRLLCFTSRFQIQMLDWRVFVVLLTVGFVKVVGIFLVNFV